MLALLSILPQSQRIHVADIEFFGTSGINVQAVRSALPVHSGDEFSEAHGPQIRNRLNEAVQKAVGHPPTDIEFTCCNARGEFFIYIGLGGANTAALSFVPAPTGSACLAPEALHLYQDATAALAKAIQQGHSSEDDAKGFSLSVDPTAREKQLAMHAYATSHEHEIEQALHSCSAADYRQAASALLGYAPQSKVQIRSLVTPTRDSDSEVRNNAIRALAILATSSTRTASEIPAENFIRMLNSGLWTDRNKAGFLLKELTRSRNNGLLHQLRAQALPSLVEMARWSDPGHAWEYRVLLGRIAGFGEDQIEQLIANGDVQKIIAAASASDSHRR